MPGRRASIRVLLAAQLAGIAAAALAALAALGPLLLARPTAARLLALAVIVAAVILAAGALLLGRAVARPVDRMLAAAERLAGSGRGLPVLGDGDAAPPGLGRAAVAFERTAAALDEERCALSAKVDELTRANAALAAARESLARSERLATVGRLAAGVAHEVGNPLGAIGGFAELARTRLEAGAPGAEVADFLARISAEAARIDAIVRDLLDFARPSLLEVAPVSAAAALDAALRLARVQERFREVRVEVELPEALPPVWADERRLAQVFLNLLLNAGDAMGGRGVIRVRATCAAGRVEVRVADGGPGIPEADLARVFEPFFTTKPPGQGTGLGLAVCHGIMASFGGSITVDDPAPGGGAVFRIGLRTG